MYTNPRTSLEAARQHAKITTQRVVARTLRLDRQAQHQREQRERPEAREGDDQPQANPEADA